MPEAGRHLTFEICGQSYAINIKYVREILRNCSDVHFVPELPESILGVINLRGEVVPVTDMRKRFKLSETSADRSVIVTDSMGKGGVNLLGFAVDSVKSVEEFREDELSPAPKISRSKEYMTGVYRANGCITVILDPPALITEETEEAIGEFVASNIDT